MHVSDLRHINPSLREKLERLYAQRTRSRVNWDSQGYHKLLRSMGDPHTRLPPVIHVAGTNGKGSIIAFLRAILEAEGYRVHAYTSPHLRRVNERFYLAGSDITDDYLERLIDEAQAQHNLQGLSFFEITTAIGFQAFSEVPADVLLLEVGMGGRLDCTNVIEDPLVTIISRISHDHTEFLGEEIEQIAAEKAGIIKPGRPCILGMQGEGGEGQAVLKVVQDAARDAQAALYAFGQDWSCFSEGAEMFLEAGDQSLFFPLPVLAGAHQIGNAGAAVMGLSVICDLLPVSQDSIFLGLRSAHWPGRLQKLDCVKAGFPAHTEVWLDCGHNDSAGAALAHLMRGWAKDDPKPIRLVLGMLGHKDVRGFLGPLADMIEGVYLCGIAGETQSLTPEGLREKAGDLIGGLEMRAYGTVQEAIEAAATRSAEACRILVAGSVYLAGDVLRLLDERRALQSRV